MKFTLPDVQKMIARRKFLPVYPFEPIESSSAYRSVSFEKKITSIIDKGYSMPVSYLFRLDHPLPWNHTDRVVNYNLQAFEPISLLLTAHSINKRQDCFNLALAYLNDWLKFVRVPTEEELNGEWSEDEKKDFLWYDMATGLRSYRLAYIIDNLARVEKPDEAQLLRLIEILDWHRQVIMNDKAFASHNNHGLYQSLGQIAMARRFIDIPGMNEALAQGQKRLDMMLKKQFFGSGMHREHSPGYHWMILCTLQEAVQSGLVCTEEQKQFVSNIEEAFSWLIQPNLILPAFGDTDAGAVVNGYYDASDFAHPNLRCALSQGKAGEVPPDRLKVYYDAGYAILNSQGAYLAQQAGFHSITHKHADHLTFVWHDNEEDIVVDSGKFGYKGRTSYGSELWQQGFWYSDPRRIYVEKTRAHNTVEIDGLDFPRRKTKLFGSALKRTAKSENNVYAIESECRYFQTIRHTRLLFVSPGKFLLVFDWLKDNAGVHHDFRQWFHLGTNLDLFVHRDLFTITRKSQPFASVLSLLPEVSLETLVRGQPEPNLNGWVAHEKGGMLLPNWAFAYGAMGVAQASFATLFSLYPDAELWEESRIAASGQGGKFSWKDLAGCHQLSFKRCPQEDFSIKYNFL